MCYEGKRTRRWLSLLLTVVMVLSLFPTTVAYAAETEDEAPADNAGVEVVDVAEGIPADLDDIAKEMLEDVAEESDQTSDADVTAEAPAAEPAEEPAAEPAEEPAAEPAAEPADETAAVSFDTDTFYRIFHLDCGRKYFTVDEIKEIIDTLAANDYTHLELAFGNGGLRFLLDDMSVDSYGSDDVKDAIKAGNTYFAANDGHGGSTEPNTCLTQDEMDAIIAYAGQVGIGIIPLLNSPGHMNAVVCAMGELGISDAGYLVSGTPSNSTVNLDNAAAVAFTKALIQKYIAYFRDQECTLFNLGADEFANDPSDNPKLENGFRDFTDDMKTAFISYVNDIASAITDAGMTPMMFNDGYAWSNAGFNQNIVVCYWTSGQVSSSTIASEGHWIINTNQNWYYVLGEPFGPGDKWCSYQRATNGVNNVGVTQMADDGSVDDKLAGAMMCFWCDFTNQTYTSAEAGRVKKLISSLAENNNDPDYFDSDAMTGKTIRISVGQSTTDLIAGYSGMPSLSGLDTNIATVETAYKEEAQTVTTIKQVTSLEELTSGEQYLIESVRAKTYIPTTTLLTGGSSRTNKETAGLALDGTPSADSTERWTITTDGSGYRVQYTGGQYLQVGENTAKLATRPQVLTLNYNDSAWTISSAKGAYLNQFGGNTEAVAAGWEDETASTDAGSRWNIYKVVTTESPAGTEVTFTGKDVGTTHVTVGTVLYTIIVDPENFDDVAPLTFHQWISTYAVHPEGTGNEHCNEIEGAAYSKTISAEGAYEKEGVPFASFADPTGDWRWEGDPPVQTTYWKATVLPEGKHQQGDVSVNHAMDGTDFTYIRYWGGTWSYSSDRVNWEEVKSTDEVCACYLQKTTISTEVDTYVADWAFTPSSNSNGNGRYQKALSVAVVYPTGQTSPATEAEIYSQATMIYWDNLKNLGFIRVGTNEYCEVEKITYTFGVRHDISDNKTHWDASDSIDWEKVTTESGSPWYDETVCWDESYGTEPVVNGAALEDAIHAGKPSAYQESANTRYDGTWGANDAILLLIYLKPVEREDSLTVKYWDDSVDTEIYKYLINVKTVGEEEPGTFLNRLVQPSGTPVTAGDFTLEDGAYVHNALGTDEVIEKDLTKVSGLRDLYNSGLYAYVKAEISADGKTLTLHYKLDNTKLGKQYVLDFGLPVRIPLSDLVKNAADVKNAVPIAAGDAGRIAYDSAGYVVYTPDEVMRGATSIGVRLTFNDNTTQNVSIGIIPASNVLYENDFLTVNTEKGNEDTYKPWSQTDATISGTQDRDQGLRYGFDNAYASSINSSMGSCWSVGFDGTHKASQYLTTTFYGTGFDLIGTAGYNTGYVYLSIKGKGVNKLIIIDTSYSKKDASDTLYQVPLAHVQDLPQGTYEVNIRAAYRAANENHRVEGTTVTIDGFRVYRSTNDETYMTGEKGAVYHNILDVIDFNSENPAYQFAFVEFKDDYKLTEKDRTEYEGNGGPQNEIYLGKNQAVVLDTDLSEGDKVQVSARAVTGTAAKLNNNQAITSNTEMYYEVTAGTGGVVVFSNTGDGLLALGNLKVLGSTGTASAAATFAFEPVTDDTLQTASTMIVNYAAGPEEAETFSPEKLKVNVKRNNGKHSKQVTVTVTASADVAKLTINGETVNPSKTRKGKRGEVSQYTYVFTDTVKRGETKSYDIIAYNADGVASETTTVTG